MRARIRLKKDISFTPEQIEEAWQSRTVEVAKMLFVMGWHSEYDKETHIREYSDAIANVMRKQFHVEDAMYTLVPRIRELFETQLAHHVRNDMNVRADWRKELLAAA